MLTRSLEGKRKATEDPESPSAAKRVKVDVSAEPEPVESIPKAPAIPFPEKVDHIPASISFRNDAQTNIICATARGD